MQNGTIRGSCYRTVVRTAVLVFVVMVIAFVATTPRERSQDSTVLMINVDDRIIRSGLALSKLGVAEVVDQYTVGGTFTAARKPSINGVVLKVLTSSGKTITRNAQFQGALLGGYAFVVFLPRQDGEIKMITITR